MIEQTECISPPELPSISVPVSLLSWFVFASLVSLSEGGHGDQSTGGTLIAICFLFTYPLVLLWLVVASILHLKNYRFGPDAVNGSHSRVYVWCAASAVYILGLGVFIALEVYGLKSYFLN